MSPRSLKAHKNTIVMAAPQPLPTDVRVCTTGLKLSRRSQRWGCCGVWERECTLLITHLGRGRGLGSRATVRLREAPEKDQKALPPCSPDPPADPSAASSLRGPPSCFRGTGGDSAGWLWRSRKGPVLETLSQLHALLSVQRRAAAGCSGGALAGHPTLGRDIGVRGETKT